MSDSISLINDPRNPYDQTYTVARLGNVVFGRPVRYINTTTEALKNTAINLLKADLPVWFGCDVGKFSSSISGELISFDSTTQLILFATRNHGSKALQL